MILMSKVQLEPLHRFICRDTVALTDLALGSSASADTVAWSLENHGDVHTEDTDVGVVLLSWEIRIVTDTKGKVAFSVKVPTWDGVVTAVKGIGQERVDASLFRMVALQPMGAPSRTLRSRFWIRPSVR